MLGIGCPDRHALPRITSTKTRRPQPVVPPARAGSFFAFNKICRIAVRLLLRGLFLLPHCGAAFTPRFISFPPTPEFLVLFWRKHDIARGQRDRHNLGAPCS